MNECPNECMEKFNDLWGEIHRRRADVERLRTALEWYGEKAEYLQRKLDGFKPLDRPAAVEAVIALRPLLIQLVELSLDGGRKARAALNNEQLPKETDK